MQGLVFSNMLHRPARTFISVLGIAVGVLLIVFTVGLSNGSMREQASREANVGAEIFFRSSGSIGLSGTEALRLPIGLVDEILKVEGVRSAVGIGQNSVDAKDNLVGKRLVDGVDLGSYSPVAGLHIVDGRPFENGKDEAVIDTGWQRQKKLNVGDTYYLYERPFTIVGIYQPPGGSRIKIPLSVMQSQLGAEGKVSSILVAVKPEFTVDQVAQNLQDTFPDNQIILTRDLEQIYMAAYPALNVFLNLFIGVAAVISALIILLTMYTTVTERTRQIGIMKALGMSNGRIISTITLEALLLSTLGIIFGIILTVVLRAILTSFITLEVEISLTVIMITVVAGLAGGAVGALYPAFRAANLDAVEALSYE